MNKTAETKYFCNLDTASLIRVVLTAHCTNTVDDHCSNIPVFGATCLLKPEAESEEF